MAQGRWTSRRRLRNCMTRATRRNRLRQQLQSRRPRRAQHHLLRSPSSPQYSRQRLVSPACASKRTGRFREEDRPPQRPRTLLHRDIPLFCRRLTRAPQKKSVTRKRECHPPRMLDRRFLERKGVSHEIPARPFGSSLVLAPRLGCVACSRSTSSGPRPCGRRSFLGILPDESRQDLQALRRLLSIRDGRLDESESHSSRLLHLGLVGAA